MTRTSRQRSAVDVWQRYESHGETEALAEMLQESSHQLVRLASMEASGSLRDVARTLSDIDELATALKVEVARQGVANGHSYTKLGQWMGISPSSVMSWANRLRDEGKLHLDRDEGAKNA